MARGRNRIETVMIHISTTPPVGNYLEELVSSGLYGKNTAEAAERLVARGIENLVREGALRRRASVAGKAR